jgi:hypothetical protein
MFPHYKDDELDVMMTVVSDKDIKEWKRQAGDSSD